MNCPPTTAFEEPQVRRPGPALPLVFFANPRHTEGSRYAMSRKQSAVRAMKRAIHNPQTMLLLLTAYCFLPTAFCLLPTAFCLLPTAFCLLPTFSLPRLRTLRA